MRIYRRGSIWWIDYYEQTRKRIQESSHSPYRRDAEQLLALRKSDVIRGIHKAPVKITLEEFGKRYMVHAKVNKRSWLRDEQMLEHLKKSSGAKDNSRTLPPSKLKDTSCIGGGPFPARR